MRRWRTGFIAIIVFVILAVSVMIGLHGYSFFVFRAGGAGETPASGTPEIQGPGQPDAPQAIAVKGPPPSVTADQVLAASGYVPIRYGTATDDYGLAPDNSGAEEAVYWLGLNGQAVYAALQKADRADAKANGVTMRYEKGWLIENADENSLSVFIGDLPRGRQS